MVEDIKQLRHGAGLSVAELAAHAGLSLPTVRAAEAGQRVRPETREALLQALRTPADAKSQADHEEVTLWLRWHDNGDEEARELLVGRFFPHVQRTVGAMPNVRRQDREDLVSAGTLGLLKALNTYDASRGMSLEHYTACKVRYAVVDAIRANDWVGKSRRRQAAELEEATDELTARNCGRPPTAAELAAYLGIDLDQLAALESKTAGTAWSISSLNERRDEHNEARGDWSEVIPDTERPGPEEELLGKEAHAALAGVLHRLPWQYREALTCRFFDGLKGKQLARRWGTHESRASQVFKAALVMARDLAFQRPLELVS